MTPSAPFAKLVWTDDGQPFSVDFDDVYFSRESGLAETRYVFLEHNRLAERWAELGDQSSFCIVETGFGTGLNFLCAWQLWDAAAPIGARLHFISTEKFPLHPDDMRRALALWPELGPWVDQLLAQYDDLAPGWHRLSLAGGRVTLTLLVGDLLETLVELDASVDAWFLDGFAPARNPEMWTPALYLQMARLSAPNASLATFTAVGHVKRGLQEAGFGMRKVSGYGRKRHMLCGTRNDERPSVWAAPWFARHSRRPSQRHALVIGAGLAGCCTAWALARRGWTVQVLERHSNPAAEASGNPQGILYCKLSPHQTPLSRFVQSSYAYSLRLLREVLPQSEFTWKACGVLQLASGPKEEARLRALASQGYPEGFLHGVDRAEASELAGVTVPAGGLFFPQAGWVHPPALCRALLEHPSISLLANAEVTRLAQDAEGWRALDASGALLAAAPVVVVSGAADTRQLEALAHLPLKAIRGQITHLPATDQSQALRTVLCAEGYVSPARAGEHHIGASFRFDRLDSEPSAEENLSNLDLLEKLSPELAGYLSGGAADGAALRARAALRCSTPDYLPLIGPVVNASRFCEQYAPLGKDASRRLEDPAPWLEGLYVNAAHGSRGLISCPLSGELIAAWLENEPLPLPRPVAEAVHPSRFLLRNLIRGTAGRQPASSP